MGVKVWPKLDQIWGEISKKHPQNGPNMDVELVRKTLKFFNLTTTKGILVKLITIMYLHKLFHLANNLKHARRRKRKISKNEPENQLFGLISANFQTALKILTNVISCIEFLVKYCYKLDKTWDVLNEKPPEIGVKWYFQCYVTCDSSWSDNKKWNLLSLLTWVM